MQLRDQNKLLYSRAGFGLPLQLWQQPRPVNELVYGLLKAGKPQPVTITSAEEFAEYSPEAMKQMTDPEMRKEKQKAFREKKNELGYLWLHEMTVTDAPLREKMALFWHGHFAVRIENPFFDQLLLQDIRANALGNFGDLLKAVSRSPAMLQFLNNQQNRKQHPNENFAREVMELFTLGRGHYTETDIKEAARAFTGWGFDRSGNFVFRERQHDDGVKKFLGKTGNFDGDDVLDILLEQKQTAVFIVQKIYRFFVSDEKINDKHVAELAQHFYRSHYDIAELLRKMLTADWLYTNEVTGARIKSPAELLVGYMQQLPLTFKNDRILLLLQRSLGQQLFYPPNVAGWPGGRNWIDSSSLAFRMRLPEALLGDKEINLSAKLTTDAEIAEASREGAKQPTETFRVGQVSVDWTAWLDYWTKQDNARLPGLLADYLLPVPVNAALLQKLTGFADKDSQEEYIKSLTILLMEMPEYQLC
jgi:uncharacterized protein (DUF1800 family)